MSTLFQRRKELASEEEKRGLSNLSTNEKSVYAFIDDEESSDRETILRHEYFQGISRSTMKRAVGVLLELNLVVSVTSKEDKRKRLLSIT